MKNGKNVLLPIPVEADLKVLVEEAAGKTRLSQAAVMRLALRIGVPEVIKRVRAPIKPKRNIVEFMDAFAGLVRRNPELVKPSRLK